MLRDRRQTALRHLRQCLLGRDASGQTDGELLSRFLAHRDEAAFSALLRRHGPMVHGICRRVLGHAQDAEDAFQATFLVLVRRAGAIRKHASVGNWLYGVAYRTSLEARAQAARRRAAEKQLPSLPEPAVAPAEPVSDLRALLDAELSRLPDKYRAALVLCELEGRPRREAARLLGIPEGTLSSRLAAGRRLLAGRLTRRGVTLSAGGLATALGVETAAALPAPLLHAALGAATGADSTASAHAVFLAERVIRAMLSAKIKGIGFLLAALVLVAGAGVVFTDAAAWEPVPAGQTAVQAPSGAGTGKKPPAPKAGPSDRDVWTLDFRCKDIRPLRFNVALAKKVDIPQDFYIGTKDVWYLWFDLLNVTGQPHTAILNFELVVQGEKDKVYQDQVVPWAEKAIREVEDPTGLLKIKNSVTIAAEPIPPSHPPGAARIVAGVAIWADLPGKMSRATVYVSGLSNGWALVKPGAPGDVGLIRRKTLQLDFKKVGDRMELVPPARWVYRQQVLRLAPDEDSQGRAAKLKELQEQLMVGDVADQQQASDFKLLQWTLLQQIKKRGLAGAPDVEQAIRMTEAKLTKVHAARAEWQARRQQLQTQVLDLRRQLGVSQNDATPSRPEVKPEDLLQQLRERVRVEEERQRQLEQHRRQAESLALNGEAWQQERELFQRLIREVRQYLEQAPADETPERRKARQDFLKSLEGRLAKGEREDLNRLVDLELLQLRLKTLQSQEPGKPARELPPAARSAPAVQGRVLDIFPGDQLLLSVGADDGIEQKVRLTVYRLKPAQVHVAEAEITAVAANYALAQVIRTTPGEAVRAGDRVAGAVPGHGTNLEKR